MYIKPYMSLQIDLHYEHDLMETFHSTVIHKKTLIEAKAN
jgi:hypothetical protein